MSRSRYDLVRSLSAVVQQETKCKHCGLSFSPDDTLVSLMPVATSKSLCIQDLLPSFFDNTPPQGWDCDRCKQDSQKKQECSMTRKLKRNPDILVISINRYKVRNGRTTKVLDSIKYNDPLDISEVTWDPASTEYRLRAVVLHTGNQADSGHYVCIARASPSDQWTRYDDTQVSEQTVERAISADRTLTPYLLFYERIGL